MTFIRYLWTNFSFKRWFLLTVMHIDMNIIYDLNNHRCRASGVYVVYKSIGT